MPRRLGDLEMTTNLGQIPSLVERFLGLGEFSDHLFGGVTPLLDKSPPGSILEHRDSQLHWIISKGSPHHHDPVIAYPLDYCSENPVVSFGRFEIAQCTPAVGLPFLKFFD